MFGVRCAFSARHVREAKQLPEPTAAFVTPKRASDYRIPLAGNVRELQNLVERAVIGSDNGPASESPFDLTGEYSAPDCLTQYIARWRSSPDFRQPVNIWGTPPSHATKTQFTRKSLLQWRNSLFPSLQSPPWQHCGRFEKFCSGFRSLHLSSEVGWLRRRR
jgi:DNA-binding NtrC family response regulator